MKRLSLSHGPCAFYNSIAHIHNYIKSTYHAVSQNVKNACSSSMLLAKITVVQLLSLLINFQPK